MAKSAFHSKSKDRTILIIVWFFFFIINGGIILFIYLQDWIERDNFLAAIKQWNISYAPYIGAITLFFWGSTESGKTSQKGEKRTSFVVALVCSIIWNGLVFIFLLPPLLGTGAIETSVKNINEIASMLSWLVAGAVGYYFASLISS